MNCLRPFTCNCSAPKRRKDETSWETVSEYNSVELNHAGYEGWTKLFTGLDKYDANKEGNTHVYYSYRVLESASGDRETGTAERMTM